MTNSKNLPFYFADALVLADQTTPNFLKETLSANSKRQQIIAATIALLIKNSDESASDHQIPFELISKTKTKDILALVHPNIPNQFISIVGQSNCPIQPIEFYHQLKEWIETEGPSEATLKALRHVERVSGLTLATLKELPCIAHKTAILDLLPNVRAAQELGEQITLVQTFVQDISEDELSRALERIAKDFQHHVDCLLNNSDDREYPKDLLERFEKRIPFPDPALNDHPNLKPLKNADEMHKAGQVLGNCAGRIIQRVLTHNCYYYLWLEPPSNQPRAFVELERIGAFWKIEEISGPHNSDLDEPLKQQITNDLTAAGAVAVSKFPHEIMSEFTWYDRDRFVLEWSRVNTNG